MLRAVNSAVAVLSGAITSEVLYRLSYGGSEEACEGYEVGIIGNARASQSSC